MHLARSLQRLRSLEVLKGFTSGARSSGFTLPASLSQLTALTRLAVSTDYLGAGLLQLTGLRSLMLHRLQVSARPSTPCRIRSSGYHVSWQAQEGRLHVVASSTAADWCAFQCNTAAAETCPAEGTVVQARAWLHIAVWCVASMQLPCSVRS
jgi:hypothetical protein